MGRGQSGINGGGGGGKLFTSAPFDEDKDNWDEFAKSFGPSVSISDANKLSGYVATWKSFDLNKKFWNNKTDTLTDSEKETVKTLDKVISTHKTPKDGIFTRYVDSPAVQNTLGLTNQQMTMLMGIQSMSNSEIALLNQALKGTQSKSLSYSSTSSTKNTCLIKNCLDVKSAFRKARMHLLLILKSMRLFSGGI